MTGYVPDLAALRRLSISERLQLVEDLWDTIAQDAPDTVMPVTPELAAELDRRLAEHRAHPDAAVPWDTLRDKLLGD